MTHLKPSRVELMIQQLKSTIDENKEKKRHEACIFYLNLLSEMKDDEIIDMGECIYVMPYDKCFGRVSSNPVYSSRSPYFVLFDTFDSLVTFMRKEMGCEDGSSMARRILVTKRGPGIDAALNIYRKYQQWKSLANLENDFKKLELCSILDIYMEIMAPIFKIRSGTKSLKLCKIMILIDKIDNGIVGSTSEPMVFMDIQENYKDKESREVTVSLNEINSGGRMFFPKTEFSTWMTYLGKNKRIIQNKILPVPVFSQHHGPMEIMAIRDHKSSLSDSIITYFEKAVFLYFDSIFPVPGNKHEASIMLGILTEQ